LDAQNKEFVN